MKKGLLFFSILILVGSWSALAATGSFESKESDLAMKVDSTNVNQVVNEYFFVKTQKALATLYTAFVVCIIAILGLYLYSFIRQRRIEEKRELMNRY